MSETSPTLPMLENVALFSDFSPAERARIELFCQSRRLELGERLFEEGDDANAFYVIRSGQLEVYRARSEGETRVGVLGAGEVVGEMALFDRENIARKRTASVRAIQSSEVVAVIEQAISSFATQEPEILARIRTIISSRKAL